MTISGDPKINHIISEFSSSDEFLIFKEMDQLFFSLKKIYVDMDQINSEISAAIMRYSDNENLYYFETRFSDSYIDVINLHSQIYEVMHQVQSIFKKHVMNDPIFESSSALKTWLHIDATFKIIRSKKAHTFFSQFGDLKEGDIKWRIGTYNELRTYTNNIIGTKNNLFIQGLKNESAINQRVILEIEAIFIYLQSLRQKVRLLNTNISHNYELFSTIDELKKNIKNLG